MKAKKENKVYRIATEAEKKRYLKEGYDIYDDDGNVLEYSPLKKIAYNAYAKLLEENKLLQEENQKLSVAATPVDDAEVVAVLAEYATEHMIDIGKSSSVPGIMRKIKEHKAKGGA